MAPRATARRRDRVAAAALALLLGVVVEGCGYGLTGSARRFAPDTRSVGIEAFKNETREHGVEKRMALAIEREFTIRGPLRVAAVPAEGDLVLTGTIRDATDRPVAFNRDDEVLIYQAMLVVDMELRKRTSGEIIWRVEDMRSFEDYGTVASVVVTTSSDFRRSTLDARDLGNFTDIQLAESRRRHALDRMVEEIARDVYNQVMEDF